MDTAALARSFAKDLIAYRNKLAGKAEDAVRAEYALHQVATALDDQHDAYHKESAVVLGHWHGHGAEGFRHTSAKLTNELKVTGAAGAAAEKVVAHVASTVDSGHTAVQQLVDEYTAKAKQVLDAGVATGTQAALMRAVGHVADLAPHYTRQSASTLRHVHAELEAAAKKLNALRKDLSHDHVADRTTHASHVSGRGKEIVHAARKELGTRENPPGSNRNPYGPTAAWCSSFATAMWRKAGVKIPVLPFSGDVFHWGQANGHAYGKHSLHEARPGDVLIFGTGPQNTSTSTHIGIVEKVEGNQVTMIEGNSGDAVRRNTHTLSASTFYGGVHP
ncbi:CHAP domain-containing protein [Amycolatopsis sp. SID8362]|uniref:CHAP domain-containing protein n=1 Tax=Amycolatopsis sp. SID8362 TaxID=2690346 RepID=UPI001370CCE8|nr:CHAP domain-containing protein [Amycolatopsis sp. SID8362]NBH11721.1 CHAP domain-containing protein [Amycolatopsis sp. SID8362]NED48413.1 CHAP domain-containing protein [Amycolatopsis sp. SID8362]